MMYAQFYGPTVDPETTKCNYVFNETVLAYSHDDIKNLGHSMSDIMVGAFSSLDRKPIC